MVDQGRQYLTREQKAPTQFTIYYCIRLLDDDEPLIKGDLQEGDLAPWKAVIKEEISALQDMQCFTRARRPTDWKNLYSRFVLRPKRIKRGDLVKYKAGLVVCGAKEHDFQDEGFSPLAVYTTEKTETCMCM